MSLRWASKAPAVLTTRVRLQRVGDVAKERDKCFRRRLLPYHKDVRELFASVCSGFPKTGLGRPRPHVLVRARCHGRTLGYSCCLLCCLCLPELCASAPHASALMPEMCYNDRLRCGLYGHTAPQARHPSHEDRRAPCPLTRVQHFHLNTCRARGRPWRLVRSSRLALPCPALAGDLLTATKLHQQYLEIMLTVSPIGLKLNRHHKRRRAPLHAAHPPSRV